ncbi:MAG: hypothetical protein BroJett025_02810 [Patescibacteria group bacterium]|nr:MAG: hypothetical protein BroJett025_02810 [Patescibacteria group bacterium]
MGVNPQLPKDQQIIEHLRHIGAALENISRDISHEMGPFKAQKMMTMAEQMQPEWDRQAEENRREEEIEELKKSNKIAERTAKIAVYGLLVTAFVGVLQLAFTVWQHFDERPQEKIIVIQEPVASNSAEIGISGASVVK